MLYYVYFKYLFIVCKLLLPRVNIEFIKHVFITQRKWENMSGLSGILKYIFVLHFIKKKMAL